MEEEVVKEVNPNRNKIIGAIVGVLLIFILYCWGYLGGIPSTMKSISSGENVECEKLVEVAEILHNDDSTFYRYLNDFIYKINKDDKKISQAVILCHFEDNTGLTKKEITDSLQSYYDLYNKNDCKSYMRHKIEGKYMIPVEEFMKFHKNIDKEKLLNKIEKCEYLHLLNSEMTLDDFESDLESLNKINSKEFTCELYKELGDKYDITDEKKVPEKMFKFAGISDEDIASVMESCN